MPNTLPETDARKLDGLRQLPFNVWVLSAVSFLTDISSEMVFNLLPLFLANVLGVRTVTIGLIEGVADSTASLLKVFSGWHSDRIGKRKGLTVIGYSLSSVAKPLLYLATSWAAVLGIRFADRVGKGIRNAPRDALLADSINKHQRGVAFGVQRAADTAGAMFGLVIALATVWVAQKGALGLERSTFQKVALISLVPGILAVVVLVLGAKERTAGTQGVPPHLSLRSIEPRFRRYLSVLILFTLGNSADAFLILRAQERGMGVTSVLGMLIAFNLVYAALSGPMGALSDRIGRPRLIAGSWLFYALLYGGFALASTGWQIWLLYALYGVYYGTTEGVTRAYVTDLVSSKERGTAFGLYYAAIGATAFPASLLAGILWQGIGSWPGIGPQSPFLFGALMALCASALFILWVRSPALTTDDL